MSKGMMQLAWRTGLGLALVLLFHSSAQGAESRKIVVKMRLAIDALPLDSLIGNLGRAAREIKSVQPAFKSSIADSVENTSFPANKYLVVRLQEGADANKVLADLRSSPLVANAEHDYELSDPGLVGQYNDPKIDKQWFHEQLKINEGWQKTAGENVLVADVESGWDTEHPDLQGQFDLTRSKDYDPKTDDSSKVNDNKKSHGTPVAGLIAAKADNGLYGAGIAHRAKLIGSQMANTMAVANDEPVWTVNTAIAILGSVTQGAQVILIEKQIPSLSSSVERIPVIYDAIKAATDAGVAVVVPAGNFSSELKEEAKLPDSGSIFVSATSRSKQLAYFSNFGARINVSAPGEEVYTVQENDTETYDFGGTSSASAITAGIVALVRSVNPALNPREIRKLLMETGEALPASNRLSAFNLFGRLNRGDEISSPSQVGGPLLQAGPAIEAALRLK